MTLREIEIHAEPIDAYEATCEVLEDATTRGAFRVLLDEEAHRYSIGWQTRLSGSRYDFRFARLGAALTRVEVELQFSGVMGGLIGILRGPGNGPHLERILADIQQLAESEEFYNDDEEEDEEAEDEAEPPAGAC